MTTPIEQGPVDVNVMGWMPIETAPKDGTIVLLYRPTAHKWGRVTPGKWSDERYAKKPKPFWVIWVKIGGTTESRAWAPTHWMPLPEAPNVELTGAREDASKDQTPPFGRPG